MLDFAIVMFAVVLVPVAVGILNLPSVLMRRRMNRRVRSIR